MARDKRNRTRALGAALALLAVTGAATAPPAAAASSSTDRPFEINLIHGMDAGEPEVAVDPVHHAVAVSFLLQSPPPGVSKCGIATSGNRGETWRVRFINPADPDPSNPVSCSDPIAASGAGGAMYVGAEWGTLGGSLNTFVSGSTDGGDTWGPSAYATGDRDIAKNLEEAPSTGISDRPWLTADPQTDTVYATLADFVPRLRRWITASHDGGKSFGPPRAIAPNTAPEFTSGDYIPSAANGVLAASYPTYGVDPDCLCRNVFETSRDDGATWTRRAAPIPAQWTAADPSHPGRFAIMSGGMDVTDWQSFNQNELLVSVTSDYGKTWSAPVAIGQDPPNPRYMPWIAYGPTGALGVSYRTKYGANPCVPDDCPETSYDMWAAISRDGGFHFDSPVRISHADSAPQLTGPGSGFAAGDDFGTVALDDKYLYVAWGDMRDVPDSSASGAQRSVFFGRVPISRGP